MTTNSDARGGVQPGNRKQIAVDFLQLVVAGHVADAYRKYVDMQGTHHNPFFAGGFPALQQAMIEDHTRSPHKRLTIRNALGDGQFVAVHSRLDFVAEERSYATVHVFRFRGDRIVELWDLGQQVPVESPNDDGMF